MGSIDLGNTVGEYEVKPNLPDFGVTFGGKVATLTAKPKASLNVVLSRMRKLPGGC